jgi:hypothetical protein
VACEGLQPGGPATTFDFGASERINPDVSLAKLSAELAISGTPSMKKTSLALLLLLTSVNAYAEMSVRQYLADRDASNKSAFDRLVKPYLTGVGEGLLWANAQLKAQKGTPFFCDSDDVSLTTNDYLAILDSETREHYVQPEYPIELLMLKGLQARFPCK